MIEEIKTAGGHKQAHEPGNKKAAARLAQGLTLVPYYARNERGERTAYCAWIKLKHGQSIAQAASRLTR